MMRGSGNSSRWGTRGEREEARPEALLSLVQLTANVMDAFTAACFLLDDERKGLRLEAYQSLSSHIAPDAWIEVGQGLVGWVAKEEKPLNVGSFRHKATTLQFYASDEEIKSFMAVPIKGSALEGVLSVDSKTQYVFTDKMLKILAGLADQVARLLQDQRTVRSSGRVALQLDLLEEYARRLNLAVELQALAEAGCAVDRRLVDYDGIALCLRLHDLRGYEVCWQEGYEEGSLLERPVSLERSLVGWVIANRQPLRLNRVADSGRLSHLFSPDAPRIGFRFFLGVPLLVEGRALGALALSAMREIEYGQQDATMLALIGHQLSSALARVFADEGSRG